MARTRVQQEDAGGGGKPVKGQPSQLKIKTSSVDLGGRCKLVPCSRRELFSISAHRQSHWRRSRSRSELYIKLWGCLACLCGIEGKDTFSSMLYFFLFLLSFIWGVFFAGINKDFWKGDRLIVQSTLR